MTNHEPVCNCVFIIPNPTLIHSETCEWNYSRKLGTKDTPIEGVASTADGRKFYTRDCAGANDICADIKCGVEKRYHFADEWVAHGN